MLSVSIPKDRKKLMQQIAALEYQVSVDTREEDRRIHEAALLALMEAWKGGAV